MEISALAIYLVMQLDKLLNGLHFVVFCLGMALVGSIFLTPALSDLFNKPYSLPSYFRKLLIAFCILGSAYLLIPSSKTVAAMLVLPPVLNNEQVQKIPSELLELLRDKIKDETLPPSLR